MVSKATVVEREWQIIPINAHNHSSESQPPKSRQQPGLFRCPEASQNTYHESLPENAIIPSSPRALTGFVFRSGCLCCLLSNEVVNP